jgi:hypothetical protein
MSLHEYKAARKLAGEVPFYALIMAAMRDADEVNLMKLREAWPDVFEEMQARYDAPAGLLVGENDTQYRRTPAGLTDLVTGELVRAI